MENYNPNLTEPQSSTPATQERSPNYTAEELYLVVRAQQKQIGELVAFTEELNARMKKWEMFFGDKFSAVFAGEVGTIEDAELLPVQLAEDAAKGFAALLAGETVAGNAPPSEVQLPEQDTAPKHPEPKAQPPERHTIESYIEKLRNGEPAHADL